MVKANAILAALASSFVAASPTGATTCSEAVAKCQIEGANKNQIVEKCQAAGDSCQKTGVFIGPITGKKWRLPRK